ncbi:MAG: hypothetical protein JJE22_17950 [Bacteroidia bacterium]|nr:hypothetical protein [Bacteroidia bacterium]
MKFLVALLLTALIAFVGGLYLPWWSVAIAALFAAAIVHQKAGKAFIAGFLGVFLLWGILAMWINIKNEGILATKIASVLPLGGSAIILILVTGLIGGLVAGFAALSGSYLRSASK